MNLKNLEQVQGGDRARFVTRVVDATGEESHELAIAGHVVEGIRVDDIHARSATSRIPGSVVLDGDEIGTRPSIDGVTPRATEEEIRTGYTRDPIVPRAAGKRVCSRCTDEAIVPSTSHDCSGSRRRDAEHEPGQNKSEQAHAEV